MYIIDPGIIPFDEVFDRKTIQELRDKVFVFCENISKTKWDPEMTGLRTIEYSFFERVVELADDSFLDENYLAFFKKIIDDYRTQQIAERFQHVYGWRSVFYQIQVIEKIIYNSILFFREHRIHSLFFQATPHSLHTWVMAKVAELMDIKVLMCQTSPLPWRYSLVEGIDKREIIKLSVRNDDDHEKKNVAAFVKMNSQIYKDAIPSYEMNRIKSRGGKFWSWKKEILDGFENLRVFTTLPFKKKLFDKYSSLVQEIDINRKYIILFLHYQPERTSLPEGSYFSQQWIIIRSITQALPSDWLLYVKEHPSTFTGKYDIRYRNPKFYDDISKLSKVKLVPIAFDTFDLIDNSECIATITGTVGVQALIRGKSVLVFGSASYLDFYAAYRINDLKDIHLAVDQIKQSEKKTIEKDFLQYLENLHVNSVSGLEDTSSTSINFYSGDVRLSGNAKLLAFHLNSII